MKRVVVLCASCETQRIIVTGVCDDPNCAEHTCMDCKREREGW